MNKTSVILLSLLIISTGFSFLVISESLQFDNTKHKFGKVEEGVILNFSFPFVNKGESPVSIVNSKVNCECTKVTFPKAPILPNQKDTIFVSFKTKGKIGFQQRQIQIVTGDENYMLTFQGVVKASKETKRNYKEKQ